MSTSGKTAGIRAAALGLVAACVLAVAACGLGATTGGQGCSVAAATACLRVLFLGNSYTYVNDLPGTFARLAESGGRQVESATVANGGETLAQHAASKDSRSAIASRQWDYVVLQEQSEVPAVAGSRDGYMYPAARTLAVLIEASGATPMLFMTPAHRDGLPASGLAGYEPMQLAINNGYEAIARELGVPIAPVGYAWFVLRRQHPEVGLWQDDGSHPSVAGTYLAACVFYAAIYRQSPEGLKFVDGLPADEAAVLQSSAAANVLDLEAQWGLR